MNILVVNCGSSSLKLRLFDIDRAGFSVLLDGAVERIGPNATLVLRGTNVVAVRREGAIPDWHSALRELLDATGGAATRSIDAIGHRVVHGGAFSDPVVIDDRVVAAIDDGRRIAPLHNGPALEQ